MFTKYFYLMGLFYKMEGWVFICCGIFIVISIILGVPLLTKNDKKHDDISKFKLAIILSFIFMVLHILVPSESTIRALAFDKIVVDNKTEVINITKDSIDYIIEKIKILSIDK